MIDFNICENEGGVLWIDDLTDVVGGYNPGVRYDPESNTTMGYRRDASVAVYVLTRVRSKGEETLCVHVSMEPEAPVSMDLPGDGYYKVTKILVPVEDFVEAEDYEEWRTAYGATTYYYDTGSSSGVASSGAGHFFRTQPPVGSAAATRIWVSSWDAALADSRRATSHAQRYRDSRDKLTRLVADAMNAAPGRRQIDRDPNTTAELLHAAMVGLATQAVLDPVA